MCADWHCLLGGIAPDPVSMSITSFYFVPPALSLIAHPCDVPETEKKKKAITLYLKPAAPQRYKEKQRLQKMSAPRGHEETS